MIVKMFECIIFSENNITRVACVLDEYKDKKNKIKNKSVISVAKIKNLPNYSILCFMNCDWCSTQFQNIQYVNYAHNKIRIVFFVYNYNVLYLLQCRTSKTI